MKDKPPIRVIRSAQQVGHGGVKPVRGGILQGGPPQSRLQQSLGSVSLESIPAEPYVPEDEKQGTLPHVEAVMAGEPVTLTVPKIEGATGYNVYKAPPETEKALAFYRKHMERRRAQRKKKRKAEKAELKRLRELVKEKP